MSAVIVPVSDPNREWKIWHIDEIYDGTPPVAGKKRYVPNTDDLVFAPVDGWLRVAAVNYTSGISTLVPHEFPDRTGVEEQEDRLLGAGPGKISESFRLYVDTSVIPHTMAFDTRLKMYGSTVRYCKVILGTVIDDAVVISRQYDQNGNLIGEQVPMEPVTLEQGVSPAIQIPAIGYCSRQLADGETVTAVFYDDVGREVSTAVMLVKNTGFIRYANETMKYVVGIELESTFLSPADDHVLECPINVNMESIARRGIVHYSSGEKKVLPIDGTKFKLFGLQRFVSTILGQKQPVTLVYYLSPDEVAYTTQGNGGQHMTEDYLATTVKVDGAYSVKLFTYPVWVDQYTGYRLEHFLYNLKRNRVYVVTSNVELAANSRPFDSVGYGISQDLTFAIDLGNVDPEFRNYRHLQTTRIALLREGIDSGIKWTVTYDKTQPSYGDNLQAKLEFVNSNLWYLKLDNDFGSVEQWLREVYEKTLPLYDATSEAKAPTPNFFRMIIAGFATEHPVSMWNHQFTLNRLQNPGDNVYLQFFYRDSNSDYELSTAGMSIVQIN